MTKRNSDVRSSIRNAGLTQWLIAERLGISEATFTRKLRQELTEDEKQEIFEAVRSLKEETAVH